MNNSTKNIVQVAYNLHNTAANPSMVQIWDQEGNKYAIDRKGNAYLCQGEEYYPLQYNPYPWQTIQARVMVQLPKVLLATAAVAAFSLLIYFTVMFECPACQEAFLNAAAFWGWATQIAFTIAFTLTLAAVAIVQFGKGVKVTELHPITEQDDAQGLLCLIASRHANDKSIEERLRVALAQMSDEYSPILAVAVIRFADPVAYLYTQGGDKDPRMDRCAPKHIAIPAAVDKTFVTESWEQYEEYCHEFYAKTKEYLLKQEHRKAARVSDATQNHYNLLRRALTLLLVLCATMGMAQKSKRVEAYLGTERYTMEKPIGAVKFVFSRAVLSRPGDGKFTYKQLLPNAQYYTDDDNAGQLISIHVGQDRILPVRREQQPVPVAITQPLPAPVAQVDPVRPRPLYPNNGNYTPVNMIPDSAVLAQEIEQATASLDDVGNQLKKAGQPIWKAIMYFFLKMIGFLIGILGFFRYISKTAAKESAMNKKGRTIVGGWIMQAQQNAAGFSLLITWIIAAFVLLDIFFMLLSMNLPLWILIALWFPILWVAEKLTDWVVPNPTVMSKGGEYKP